MSIYEIGEISSPKRRRSVAEEVTWNEKSGVVKVGNYRIGEAKTLRNANGVAIGYAKKHKEWFKMSDKRAVSWHTSLEKASFSDVYLRLDSVRTKFFNGRLVQTRIRNNRLFISMEDFKEPRRNEYVEGSSHQMSFCLDSIDDGGWCRNGGIIIKATDDNDYRWSLTFS